jgi:hypothetical protein
MGEKRKIHADNLLGEREGNGPLGEPIIHGDIILHSVLNTR